MNKFKVINIYMILAFRNRKLSNNMKNLQNNYVKIILQNSVT